VSKKRRKNGSSNSGLCPGCSLMVPRVAIFTTEGETRLTMGASEGIGAASREAGEAAYSGPPINAAARAAAANLRGDGSALCAERSMIVTSMQLTISSRRDIAVLQKESSALEGEEDVNDSVFRRRN